MLERFQADGYEVADLRGAEDPAEVTADAVRGGAAVICQATLTGDRGPLFGRPDFLVRAALLAAPDGEGRPAGPHYEVVDVRAQDGVPGGGLGTGDLCRWCQAHASRYACAPGGDFAPQAGSVYMGQCSAGVRADEFGVTDDGQRGFHRPDRPVPG